MRQRETLFSYDDFQAIHWLNVQAAGTNYSSRKMEVRSVLSAPRKRRASSTASQGACRSEK
jgi:hypothetical protein